MNYQETLEWIFNKLPMYQTQGATAYRKDITNTVLLAEHLGHPEKQLRCIHVAGTNGKGSTSHLLASVLMEAGYKVGLYTSPHLKDYRERITINGEPISETHVCDFITRNKPFFETHNLSFFEMSVGLAFDYFVKEEIDIAVIEVGMGGRLDSTNIIMPLISVITNIGLDHTQFLGDTLEAIAFEKAGIIKNNIPVVIGEYVPETKPIFTAKAKETNSELYLASDVVQEDYPCGLLGDYQFYNKKTVIQTLRVLQEKQLIQVSEDAIKNGFLKVIDNTHLQGRWQQLGANPKIICDTAHNAHGLTVVMEQLKKEKYNQLHLVLGVVNDKKLDDILILLPKNAKYYFCQPNISRGLAATVLQEKAATFGLKGAIYNSVSEAYEHSRKIAGTDDLIYVGGSNFVVAEIL
ncbi:bifunctional folylpolyglutamate synthase/dihydrofolate synthase [Flavobacterium sp.]|jgi:dihydrofolate synthase/folylpolyglutamate synthase|uniref:bifunctional folylpolyglutamate synthase/dihydrofolate synthase n=1 Tax=Flavobacterium sp. TaxID=239 RepID=UPI003784EE0D